MAFLTEVKAVLAPPEVLTEEVAKPVCFLLGDEAMTPATTATAMGAEI